MQGKYIKVNKPSGLEEYKVLNAFEKDGSQYIVLDSKLKDSNQLTITFVSKVNGDSLEYVEGNEWDSLVKQELIAIVKGNSNSVCVETLDAYQAGEQFAHPLALKDEHINILSNNYQLPVENKMEEVEQQIPEMINPVEPVVEETPVIEETVTDIPVENVEQPIEISEMSQQEIVENQIIEPVIMEEPQVEITSEPTISDEPVISFEQPVEETYVNEPVSVTEESELDDIKNNIISLIDKLKEKENELKIKEEQLNNKEIEINSIKKDAEIALANAQAKEQVAEIAFNNAKTISQEPDINGGIDPVIEEGPTLTLGQEV